MTSHEWIARLWMACLGLTAALLLVAGTRRVFRQWFGSERAIWLWCLPPLAALASVLPHATPASTGHLPAVLVTVASAPAALPTSMVRTHATDASAAILMLWLAGAIGYLGVLAIAQWRFRRGLDGAVRLADVDGRSVWRSRDASLGPAMIGAWRPRIVLPDDFEQRYDVHERELILSHEAAHARRGDGVWSLLAQLMLALSWFHPLAWWAVRAFRLDQELACDAAVLRRHPRSARRYAEAMLKTQASPLALPIGCAWSPRHPMIERIALLAVPRPGRARRALGRIAVVALSGSVAFGVYAATAQTPTLFYPSAATMEQAMQAAAKARDAYARFVLSHGQDNTGATSNNAIGLPAADSGAFGAAVQRLEVVAGGHVLVSLRHGAGGDGGRLDFFWTGAVDGNTLQWTCSSEDIPQVEQFAPACRYAVRRPVDHDGITLKLALGVNGQPPRLRATTCLKPGQYYQTEQGGVAPLPDWLARFSAKPAADGQLEIAADLSGGSLGEPVHPKIRVLPGQAGAIQIGNVVDGKNGQPAEDHTLRAELTASVGC